MKVLWLPCPISHLPFYLLQLTAKLLSGVVYTGYLPVPIFAHPIAHCSLALCLRSTKTSLPTLAHDIHVTTSRGQFLVLFYWTFLHWLKIFGIWNTAFPALPCHHPCLILLSPSWLLLCLLCCKTWWLNHLLFSLLTLSLGDFIHSFDFSHHYFTDEDCVFTPGLSSRLQPYTPAFSLVVSTWIDSPAWTHALSPANHVLLLGVFSPWTTPLFILLCNADLGVMLDFAFPLQLHTSSVTMSCPFLTHKYLLTFPLVSHSIWNSLVPGRHYYFPGPLQEPCLPPLSCKPPHLSSKPQLTNIRLITLLIPAETPQWVNGTSKVEFKVHNVAFLTLPWLTVLLLPPTPWVPEKLVFQWQERTISFALGTLHIF